MPQQYGGRPFLGAQPDPGVPVVQRNPSNIAGGASGQPVTPFRCAAEFGRYDGMQTSSKPQHSSSICK
jgi:hypothetical protein